MRTSSRWTRSFLSGIVLTVIGGLAGRGILDVEDPTRIQDSAVQNTDGAELLRVTALQKFSVMISQTGYYSGLMSDEFFFERPTWIAPLSTSDEFADRRDNVQLERIGGLAYSFWPGLRLAVAFAIGPVRQFSAKEHVGELYALRGMATLGLAENFCSGFPLNNPVDERVQLSGPITTEEALAFALADFDSAVTLATDSARILNFAKLGRARVLLNLGRYEEAGEAVTGIPTDFNYIAEFASGTGQENRLGGDIYLWQQGLGPLASVSDREGGNGLDFTSANDPRAVVIANGTSLDSVTPLFRIGKYPDRNASITVASGVDARLIEAEAALHAGNASWLQILKDLRTWSGAPAGLAPLTDDPTTQVAKEDLLFRERAFWLFATGRRLGDLRRLVRAYGRSPESVFPVGAYRLGGEYRTGTNLPFDVKAESSYNPAVTGCLSR